jgi:hypothetical protein
MQTLRIPEAPQNRQLGEPGLEVAFASGSRRRVRPFAGSRVLRIEGERPMRRFLHPSIQVITPACGKKRQEKLLRKRREKEATHV